MIGKVTLRRLVAVNGIRLGNLSTFMVSIDEYTNNVNTLSHGLIEERRRDSNFLKFTE